MRRAFKLLEVLLFILIAAGTVLAQQGEKIVITTTGQKFKGTVTKQDDKFITMRIEGGTAKIPVSIVEKTIDVIEEGKFQLLIVHDKELAMRLHEELGLGADFTRLVKDYSQHISVFKKGMTDYVERDYFPEKVSKMAFIRAKNQYTSPIEVDKAFYIVKVIDKRKTEKDPTKPEIEKPDEGEGDTEPADKPEEKRLFKVHVLPAEEKTLDAKTGSMGSHIQQLLIAELCETTGIAAFMPPAEITEEDESPDYAISGEVSTMGSVHAIQFILKDAKGRKIHTTDRITAVCTEDDIKDLEKAIKLLAESLAREIQAPR